MNTEIQKRHDLEPTDVFEDSRSGDLYEILYINDEIVLLRSEAGGDVADFTHRIEKRSAFDEYVAEGRFEYLPDETLTGGESVDWATVDYIGDQINDRLHDRGFDTPRDIRKATDDELLDVDGLGQSALSALRGKTR